MAQLQKVERQIELKCQADKIFDVWVHNPNLVSKFSPNKMQNVELVEGKWNEVGAVKNWTYLISDIGERSFVKTKLEELDEENRYAKYNVLGGLMNYYKTLYSNLQVTPKGEGCVVKWWYEYEKMNEDAPEPNMYIDLLISVTQDIGASLHNA